MSAVSQYQPPSQPMIQRHVRDVANPTALVAYITRIASVIHELSSGWRGSPKYGRTFFTPSYVLMPPSRTPSAPAMAASAIPELGLGCLPPSRQPTYQQRQGSPPAIHVPNPKRSSPRRAGTKFATSSRR